MTKHELVEKIQIHVNDGKETVNQLHAVRSFVEQDLLSRGDGIDEQVSLIYSLIKRSEAIFEMVDHFTRLPLDPLEPGQTSEKRGLRMVPFRRRSPIDAY